MRVSVGRGPGGAQGRAWRQHAAARSAASCPADPSRALPCPLHLPSAEANLAFPIEFCGGTHLDNTSAARAFALLTEEGIAKGVR